MKKPFRLERKCSLFIDIRRRQRPLPPRRNFAPFPAHCGRITCDKVDRREIELSLMCYSQLVWLYDSLSLYGYRRKSIYDRKEEGERLGDVYYAAVRSHLIGKRGSYRFERNRVGSRLQISCRIPLIILVSVLIKISRASLACIRACVSACVSVGRVSGSLYSVLKDTRVDDTRARAYASALGRAFD